MSVAGEITGITGVAKAGYGIANGNYKDAALGAGQVVLGKAKAVSKLGGWLKSVLSSRKVTNPVPETLARVVPDTPITRSSGTLGAPGAPDVFVTAPSDIAGLSPAQIADRLTIPQSPTGYRVIELPTPRTGVASPVNRSNPGFVGGGQTLGGAREFVIPNGPIPIGSTIRVVK